MVLEWQKTEQTEGPPQEDRISTDDLAADAQAVGLRIAEQRDLDERHYLCVLAPTKG